MLEFETYLKSNTNVQDAAACGIEYSHNTSVKNKNSVNHTVTVKITWTDRNAKILRATKISFQNDTLTKASEKNIGQMSTVELNHLFRQAKCQITRELIRQKQEKINQMQMDVMMMNNYINQSHTSPNTHTTTSMPPVIQQQQPANSKPSFDM